MLKDSRELETERQFPKCPEKRSTRWPASLPKPVLRWKK